MNIAERILVRQDREGMLKRSLERIIQLYTDKSHFVYELLQNAEDASASKIRFVAKDNQLEVYHDGNPFTEENLQALCDIGKSDKVEDLNKIGEFGVGFKSVFGICETVKLYSQSKNSGSNFAVEIVDFTKPVDIMQQALPPEFTTKFVFEYCVGESFSGFKTIESLRKSISSRLKTLGYSALLFMKNLQSIEFQIQMMEDLAQGRYAVKREHLSKACSMVSSAGAEEARDHYLVYSKDVPNMQSRTVNIAYLLVKNKEGSVRFQRPQDPYISVFFPTETESKLNFIVQGPFRTTPNRSSIPFDDDDNRDLAKLIAELLSESVLDIRKRGLLDVHFLSLLPTKEPDRLVDWLFLPVLAQVKRLMIEEDILPTTEGGFTNANHAVLARGAEITKVFSGDILTDFLNRFEDEHELLFFEDGEITYWPENDEYEPTHTLLRYHWVDTRITENTFPELHRFLSGDLNITIIRPEGIPGFINKRVLFFENRSAEWLNLFYQFLTQQSKASDILNPSRYTSRSMILMPFIKTSGGQFVAPYRETGGGFGGELRQNIYLPTTSQLSNLLYVDSELFSKFPILFKDALNLTIPDEFSYFMISFKERYHVPGGTIDLEQYFQDVVRVLNYLDDSNHRQEMNTALKSAFFVHCSDNYLRNPYSETISTPVLENVINANEYFSPGKAHTISDLYEENNISTDSLRKLGVLTTLWINSEPLGWREIYYGNRTQGKDAYGFASALDLFNINQVLSTIYSQKGSEASIKRSRILFR